MLTFIPANAQHIGKRNEQQDSFAFSDPDDRSFTAHGGLLGVVADGMGGLVGGAEASTAAVRTFLAAYHRKKPIESIYAALRRSLSEANTAVLAVSRELDVEEGIGTTLAAVVLHNRSLYWVSVGDSRLYLLREGQLARVNADHNRKTELWAEIAAERINRETALADPEAAHLTSFLGMTEIPVADASVRPFSLMHDDIVFVCTDGVYRSLSEREIVQTLQDSPPAPACATLQSIALAKDHATQDNLTVIAIKCHADAIPKQPVSRVQSSRKVALTAVLCVEILVAAGLTQRIVWHEPGRDKDSAAHAQSTASEPASIPPAGQTPPTKGASESADWARGLRRLCGLVPFVCPAEQQSPAKPTEPKPEDK